MELLLKINKMEIRRFVHRTARKSGVRVLREIKCLRVCFQSIFVFFFYEITYFTALSR